MHILMPVDGSAYSEAAVAFVTSRKTLLKHPTEVELVNVQYPAPSRAARALGKDVVASWHETEAAKALKPAEKALRRAGADATARYAVGTVANELASIVAADRADLIVMGSHGHTGLKSLLLGSVASTVAVSCTTPLLVMRGAPVPRRDSLRLGIAVDGSPLDLAVARFVALHHDLFGASPSVSLIHVVPDLAKIAVPGWSEREVPTGIRPAQVEAMHKAAFENVFGPVHEVLATAGISASEVRLVGQAPGDAIAAEATCGRLDLLAMGSVGFGAARHGPMGSVATRVAGQCRTALLLVRAAQATPRR
jgi:nucleotide-binding universal stress UspA family protein